MLLSSYLKNTRFDARIARLDMSSIFKFFEMKKKAILPVCIIVALTFNLRASLTLRTDGDQLGMTALQDLPDLSDLPASRFFNQNLHQLSDYKNVVQGPPKINKNDGMDPKIRK